MTDPPDDKLRGRVLIVDDNADVRAALRRMVGKAHDVVATSSGSEALDVLARDPKFDVIVLDLMMPQMSGVEVHAQLALASPDLARRVLFLSGGTSDRKSVEYLASVPIPRLEKPLRLAAFREILADMIARARGAG